ncbi:MAG: hypothetical protein ACK4FA_02305, partial [Candidatus Paceibacteria bacterium]
FKAILHDQEGLPFWEDIDFELDLMTLDAKENFDAYLKLGPRRVIFHLEAFSDFEEFKGFIEGLDPYVREATEIGVALNTATPVENIYPIINSIDFVQCMGIAKIGFQGEEFDTRVLEQVRLLKSQYPDVIVSVDGAVSLSSAPLLIEVGVDRLVVGSAIFNSDDIIKRVNEFQSL